MVLIKGKGFTAVDDYVYDPVDIEIPWRDPVKREVGVLHVVAKPKVPQGVLFDVEAGMPSGLRGLLIDSLFDTDGVPDPVTGDPDPATSSRARLMDLLHQAGEENETREVGIGELNHIMRELFAHYVGQRTASGPPLRPTKPAGPSSGPPSPTGSTSTDVPYEKASTSAPYPVIEGSP